MRKSNYDKYPVVEVKGFENEAVEGYLEIAKKLSGKKLIIIDCYPGVRAKEVVDGISKNIKLEKVFYAEDAAFSGEKITEIIKHNITDDRVFGIMSHHKMIEFFDKDLMDKMREEIRETEGTILLIGVGATLIAKGDVVVYADLARWEIQSRYRSKELANWKMDNFDEDILKKYKRGFFIEWRVADNHKKKMFDTIDFLLDTNTKDEPKMVSGKGFVEGIKQTVSRPFRVVPFFDPGVWGGQWMKEVCDLDREKENYAWCFDCVPEENSLLLQYGDITVEVPSIDAVLYRPIELLGSRVHARFGAEFPIRFDFLDTIGGQNLSLQVHPLVEYIQEQFGMHYTQDESYYMLDADKNAKVYLGIKTGVDKSEMINALKEANKGGKSFDATKYVNEIPAKKHDHFLIPAGTVHCSGSGAMVLEVSATPYIFTFKLWDWDRLGLDGLPRPVHIEHGEEVINFDCDTEFTNSNLVNQVLKIAEGDGFLEERTGLHEREFIETRRHWFEKTVRHETGGSVNVLNLIEGEEAIVESPTNAFEPFIVHFAETFIIPESVKEYTIRPYGKSEGKKIATLKAYVRL